MLIVKVESGGADAEAFFADVLGILERVAQRAGADLHVTGGATTLERQFHADGRAASVFGSELGIHRAQVATQPSSRVATYTVSVALAETAPTDIIRTYNYPLGQVTFHRTGAKAVLAEVLSGTRRE